MKAFILAAGLGTRLEPLTLAVPKPMVPLVNKPIMQHNLELLKKYGFKEIYANIHYFPEQLEGFFGDGSSFGVKLTYSFEDKLLGTAGGLKKMIKIAGGINEAFLVLSSDALTDINLDNFLSFHKKKNALATIALSKVSDPSQFGVVLIDENERIISFQEKPSKDEALSDLANAGIYVFEPEILKYIPDDGFCDFGKNIFPILASKGERIFGYKMSSYWSDIGGLKQYIQASIDALHGLLHIDVPGKKVSRSTWLGRRVKVDRTSYIDGYVLLGDSVCVGKNVKIFGESIIGNMTLIGENSEIKNSIIWSDVYIGRNVKIKNSIIGSWCYIDDDVVIEEDCVIANRSRISKDSVVRSGSRLKPGSVI